MCALLKGTLAGYGGGQSEASDTETHPGVHWLSLMPQHGLCLQRRGTFFQWTQRHPIGYLSSPEKLPAPVAVGWARVTSTEDVTTTFWQPGSSGLGLGSSCSSLSTPTCLSFPRGTNQNRTCLSFRGRGYCFYQPWGSKRNREITVSAWKLKREASDSSERVTRSSFFLFLVAIMLARRPVLINLYCQSRDSAKLAGE